MKISAYFTFTGVKLGRDPTAITVIYGYPPSGVDCGFLENTSSRQPQMKTDEKVGSEQNQEILLCAKIVVSLSQTRSRRFQYADLQIIAALLFYCFQSSKAAHSAGPPGDHAYNSYLANIYKLHQLVLVLFFDYLSDSQKAAVRHCLVHR